MGYRIAIFVGLIALAMSLPLPASAGDTELTASGVRNATVDTEQVRVSVGYVQGPIFGEFGIRQEDGPDLVAGIRDRVGPVELRLGATYLLSYKGRGNDRTSAAGAVAEVSTEVGQLQPFARFASLHPAEHVEELAVGVRYAY